MNENRRTHEEMGPYHMWLNQVRKNILWSVYRSDGTVATLINVGNFSAIVFKVWVKGKRRQDPDTVHGDSGDNRPCLRLRRTHDRKRF